MACEQLLLRIVGTGEPYASIDKPVPTERTGIEKRRAFAARANSIPVSVECPDELRPKLRDAIVEAMLWAQTQTPP